MSNETGDQDEAGMLLLEAARLKAEARGHVPEKAQIIDEVVRSKPPDLQKAAGNELAQPGKGSAFLFKTLEHPDYLAAEASERRLQLASEAGAAHACPRHRRHHRSREQRGAGARA